jgi:hypothetical protein
MDNWFSPRQVTGEMNRRMNLAVEDITMQDVQHIRDKSSMAVYTTGCTKGVRTAIEEKNWTED